MLYKKCNLKQSEYFSIRIEGQSFNFYLQHDEIIETKLPNWKKKKKRSISMPNQEILNFLACFLFGD